MEIKSKKDVHRICRKQMNKWFKECAIPKLDVIYEQYKKEYKTTRFHMEFNTTIDLN